MLPLGQFGHPADHFRPECRRDACQTEQFTAAHANLVDWTRKTHTVTAVPVVPLTPRPLVTPQPPTPDWTPRTGRRYEHYERVENGDWNWIIPDKFMAFSSPHDPPLMDDDGRTFISLTPGQYVPIFRSLPSLVPRLDALGAGRQNPLRCAAPRFVPFFKPPQ